MEDFFADAYNVASQTCSQTVVDVMLSAEAHVCLWHFKCLWKIEYVLAILYVANSSFFCSLL